MEPHGSLYIRVFAPSMVSDYHRSLMCSRTLLIWHNSAKFLTMFMWEQAPEFKHTHSPNLPKKGSHLLALGANRAPHLLTLGAKRAPHPLTPAP